MKAKSSRKNEPNSPPAARGAGREKWRVASGGRTVARVLRALMAAGTPRFLDISRHFTIHLFSTWIPSSARGKGDGLRSGSRTPPRANTVKLTVKSWEAVG